MKDNDRPFNLIPNMQFNRHNFEEILNFQFSKMSSYSWICPFDLSYHFNIKLAKFDQNQMIRTIHNFELFLQKAVSHVKYFDISLAPF